MRKYLTGLPVFAAVVVSASGAMAATPSLIGLGDLPGGDVSSSARGVSADGSVVVGSSRSASGGEAFRWTADGGMVGLGDFEGGTFISGAVGVSNDGVTTAGSGWGFGSMAFRHTVAGGMLALGDLPGGAAGSTASAISADGSTVVGYSNSTPGTQAFVHTVAGGMVGIGDLPGGDFYSLAFGVSGDGSVVVGQSTSADGGRAFRYTADEGMVNIGSLASFSPSIARGVSADGSTIVGASGLQAFRHTVDGGMVGLGQLPNGGYQSEAQAVNGDGSAIVGWATVLGEVEEIAFYWDANLGMQSLWDVLLSAGVNPAADGSTSLEFAYDVSPDGQFVVGHGTRNGNREAFLAVVPEPAAIGLLAFAALAVRRRRREA